MAVRSLETFSMEELEFFAENESIKIQPLYRIEKIELITGSYGPFQPLRNVAVPLWLAIIMKRANRCRIVAPEWLEVEYLEKQLSLEKRPNSQFVALPHSYVEVASLLYKYAEDDIANSQAVRRKLQDLREVRAAKIQLGLQVLNPVQLQMDNLALAEINAIRPVFKAGFDQLASLRDLSLGTNSAGANGEMMDPGSYNSSHNQLDHRGSDGGYTDGNSVSRSDVRLGSGAGSRGDFEFSSTRNRASSSHNGPDSLYSF